MPMTSRERVLAAARRQTPDRIPRHIELEAYVAGQLRAHFATDNLLPALRDDVAGVGANATALRSDYSRYFTQPGVTWEEWGRGRIWDALHQYASYHYPLEHAETPGDILAYPWPDLHAPYRYEGVDRRTAHLQSLGYAVRAGLAETVFEIAWQLRSMERLFADMIAGSEMAHLLLDQITERRAAAAAAFARAGVDIIQLGDDVAMQTGLLMSRKMWRQWFQPRLARVIAAARAAKEDVIIEYHSDGKIDDLIPDLIETGVDILNPVQPECVDHAWVKAAYGGRLAFSGGLGVQSVLPFGSPEDVYAHTRAAIQTLGQGGGYIVGPSHVIERDVPLENILAMLQAMDEG